MPQTNGDVIQVVPLTNGVHTLVVPHTLVADILPLNVTSSLKLIALPPVRELNASAHIVPDALMLPDTVKASLGEFVPMPTLPPV